MKSVTSLLYLFILAYLAESLLTWLCPKTYIDYNIGDPGGNLVGEDIINSEPCNSSITEESITSGK